MPSLSERSRRSVSARRALLAASVTAVLLHARLVLADHDDEGEPTNNICIPNLKTCIENNRDFDGEDVDACLNPQSSEAIGDCCGDRSLWTLATECSLDPAVASNNCTVEMLDDWTAELADLERTSDDICPNGSSAGATAAKILVPLGIIGVVCIAAFLIWRARGKASKIEATPSGAEY